MSIKRRDFNSVDVKHVHITLFFILVNVILTAYTIPSNNDESSVTISLSSYNSTVDNVQVVDTMVLDNSNSNIYVDVIDIPSFPASFFILQVHSFKHNISLSYNSTVQPHFYVNGTNVGLVHYVGTKKAVRFYLHNEKMNSLSLLISVNIYQINAPVPGGCNMEFDVETAPYQKLIFNDNVITIDAQPAASPFGLCELPIVRHNMYHMFLPEQDFTSDSYFNGIKKMMTFSSIIANARKVPAPLLKSRMRRTYSAYHGTGEVFVAVATFMNVTSVYVPIVSYGCSSISWNDSCEILTSTFSKIFAASTFFIGLFVCYLGHKFFKTEMFLLGFLGGSLLTYITITLINYETLEANLWTTAVAGIVAGLLWLSIWCIFGSPMISVTLATLMLSFLLASIIFYCGLSDMEFLQEDISFWCLFTSVIIFVSTLLISITHKANILACSVIGAYSVIICCDHFIGGNLKYIIVNIIRRATYDKFQTAIIDPPYQLQDMVLTLLWIILILTGVMIQWYQQKGKPPFPPPPCLRRRNSTFIYIPSNSSNRNTAATLPSTEQSPLLIDSGPVYRGPNQGYGVYNFA